jgi:Tudor domain
MAFALHFFQVESQKGKNVEVYFVDFGNTDKVDSIDVVGLPAEFGMLPCQVCSSEIDIFEKKMLSNQRYDGV